MNRTTTALVTLVLSVSSGCSPRDAPGPTVSRTDSAGVVIVETGSPIWSEADVWAISDVPVLEIGATQGDPAYEFYRVYAVTSLSDGRIVVANGGTSQLRFYDATGSHLMDVGRQGDGPGEFQYLYRVWTIGADSIVAFDNSRLQVTIFDSQGSLVRTAQLPVDTIGFPSVQGGFRDGSFLTVSATGSVPRQDGWIDGPTWFFSRFSAEGVLLNRVGEGKAASRWGMGFGGRFSASYLPLTLGIPPFGLGGASLYLGDGTAFEIRQLRTDGTLQRIIRWNAERRPVTPEIVDLYRSYRVAQSDDPEDQRWEEAWVAEVPFPESMPSYQSVKTDALGNLWIEQYRTPWEDQPRWWVFAQDGRWLGEVPIPAGFRIDEIGADYLLGVRRDEYDVEYVTMYALRRGSS